MGSAGPHRDPYAFASYVGETPDPFSGLNPKDPQPLHSTHLAPCISRERTLRGVGGGSLWLDPGDDVTAHSAPPHPLSGPVGQDFGLGDKVGVVAAEGRWVPRAIKTFSARVEPVRTACRSRVREGPKWKNGKGEGSAGRGQRRLNQKPQESRHSLDSSVGITEFRITDCFPLLMSLGV